jgi:N6-L-threonylcarbamoyladenine synthase
VGISIWVAKQISLEANVMICLGIESTAHTFGVSVVEGEQRTYKARVLSDIKDVYKPQKAGSGIHPRDAARHHSLVASSVLADSLDRAHVSIREVDCIGFSKGPGLGPCLRVGGVVGRTLSAMEQKPLVGVNHAVGHLEIGSLMTGLHDPVVLLVSGGHTLIVQHNLGRWRIFGETLDLTVGQLVDQFGRTLGLTSPCGPRIEQLASKSQNFVNLPYTVKGNDVSFSGILSEAKKMIALNYPAEDLAFSLQQVAFAELTEVCERALSFSEKQELLLTGGVAANQSLASMLQKMCKDRGVRFAVVPKEYSGDCGAQIGWVGLLSYESGLETKIESSEIKQSWRIDEVEVPWRNS